MFILKQWSTLNMFDRVEESVTVSEDKQLLIERAQRDRPRLPLLDLTLGETLDSYCQRVNRIEGRVGGRRVSAECFDEYWTVGEIEEI